ncbi:hypothetical protein [Butyrivibrio sp. FCS006]|uniref:hypothetical protein n=1 Tax=Butyrivibrio sp. FCS006 TaxID=1280684 RepID=UPI000479DBC4|nr:hypothetical protein [Butyrivibrio sp. FCS006]
MEMIKLKILARNLYWDLVEHRMYDAKRLFPEEISSDTSYHIFRDEYNGMFSYVEMCLRYIHYAIRNNYYPIIDMTGCTSPFVKKGEEDTINWWELYFKQPFLREMPASFFSENKKCEYEDSVSFPYGREAVLLKKSRWFWGNMYERYFHLNEESSRYVENERNKLLGSKKVSVLGVKIRGTDYKIATGHPLQPPVDRVIREVKKIQNRYDKIYLATEEYANVRLFKEIFKDKIIVNEDNTYFDVDDDSKLSNTMFEKNGSEYQAGLEYLSSIMILAGCDGLVGGVNGGTIAATYINNGKYADLKLLYYGINK